MRLLKQAVRAFTQRTRDSIVRTLGQQRGCWSVPDRGNSPQEEEYWVAPGKTKNRRPVSRDKNVINDGRSAGGDITNYDRGGVLRLDSGRGSNFRNANRKFRGYANTRGITALFRAAVNPREFIAPPSNDTINGRPFVRASFLTSGLNALAPSPSSSVDAHFAFCVGSSDTQIETG